jgi:hypothetical protein
MKNRTVTEPKDKDTRAEREPYEAPAIIYEGLITTASGGVSTSPQSNPTGRGADPADIFGGG